MTTMVTLTLFGSTTELYVNPLVASSVSDAPDGGSYVALGDGRSVRVAESADDVQFALTAGLGEQGPGGQEVEIVRFTPEFEVITGNSAITFPVNNPWWVQRTTDRELGRTMVTVAGQLNVSTLAPGKRTVAFTLPVTPDGALPADDGLAGMWMPVAGGGVGLLSGQEDTENRAVVIATMDAGLVSVSFSYIQSES